MLCRLLDMLGMRLEFCRTLEERTRKDSTGSPHRHLDLLYQTWLLSENVFSLLEALAEPDHYDIRTAASRRHLLDAIGGRSLTKGLGSFVAKAWGLRAWKHVFTDEVFRERGFIPEDGSRVLSGLISRSQARLEADYEAMRAFRMKYGELCRAHKHGRAAFGLRLKSRSADGAGQTKITLSMAPGDLTVFRPSRSETGGDATLIRLTVDDELSGDIDRTLQILAFQIPLLSRRMLLSYDWCMAYLEVPEGRLPADHRVAGQLDLFVPPYSSDELRLLGLPSSMTPSDEA